MSNQLLSSQGSSRYCRLVYLACLTLALSGCNWIDIVSVSSTGEQADRASTEVSISADGRYIAFQSYATNLVPDDLGDDSDIYVHDALNNITTRVSVDSAGNEGNGESTNPSISGNGRYITFQSYASNLVADDTNGSVDIFVHDLSTHTTTRASVNSSGIQGNFGSYTPSISGDGCCIAFESGANNLAAGDIKGIDIFVHNRNTATTTLISVSSAGIKGNLHSGDAAISDNGRYIAFKSGASNLVAGDTNSREDVFVHDLNTHSTIRVSVDSAGNQGNDSSGYGLPSISRDGRYVAFRSAASNLVAGDTNDIYDVFVHDLSTHSTNRVNVDSSGIEANSDTFAPSMSGDGRFVSFRSDATNLVMGDTNQYDDVFVHDRLTGTTSRVSVDAFGVEGDFNSFESSISGDGHYVAFISDATNLVPGYTRPTRGIFIRALTQLTVTSVIPDTLPIGVTTPITIIGSNFLAGAIPYLGGALFTNIEIVDENTITADVTVQTGSTLGTQEVSVGLPGTGPGPLTGAAGVCTDCVTFSLPPGC